MRLTATLALALTAFLVAVSAGCGEPPPLTLVDPRPPATPCGNPYTAQDETRIILTGYFADLAHGEYEAANRLTTGPLHVLQADQLAAQGIQYAAVLDYPLQGFLCGQTKLRAVVRVKVHLEVRPGSPWSPGENVRYAVLVQEPGTWKLEALEPSLPPNVVAPSN